MFIPGILHAQNEYTIRDAKVTVHVIDNNLLNQEMTIEIKQDEISDYIGSITYTAKSNKSGEYTFIIPKLKTLARFNLTLSSEGNLNRDLLLEPGDDIKITFLGNKLSKSGNVIRRILTYSGQGSGKLNADMEVSNTKPNNLANLPKVFNQNYLDTLFVRADSTWQNQKRILNKYKNEISPYAYKMIEIDNFGWAYYMSFSFLTKLYSDPVKRQAIRSYYPKVKDIGYRGNDTIAASSNRYLTFLMSRTELSAMINADPEKSSPKKRYKEIMKEANGILKEKLLTRYIVTLPIPISEVSGDDVLTVDEINEALIFVNNPKYKEIISNVLKTKGKGAIAYSFILPDTTGRMISLSDFNNKVVVLDYWFTGCGSCVTVAEVIDHEILPKFKNNSDVVFISVSVDKDQKTWKNSVKTGTYTNPKSINLYTGGLGWDHPFIKNYNFQGFPHVMLIDRKGRIFSSEMPNRDGAKMVELINDALKTGI